MNNNMSQITNFEKKEHGSLNGIQLEKGDTLAIIIAALTTLLPFVLIIFLICFIIIKLIFRL
ncbi:hypothetical protein SH1V18_17610 [Vallitalea longa]|uniref:Uncharacterized protein n=1 Tax=Vallitalea longa TaxID=2936439 RepID=A0A9W6DDR1_9FIRM|nr:hypothetical protein SH1V18_17610 [Vallitalea longa]